MDDDHDKERAISKTDHCNCIEGFISDTSNNTSTTELGIPNQIAGKYQSMTIWFYVVSCCHARLAAATIEGVVRNILSEDETSFDI